MNISSPLRTEWDLRAPAPLNAKKLFTTLMFMQQNSISSAESVSRLVIPVQTPQSLTALHVTNQMRDMSISTTYRMRKVFAKLVATTVAFSCRNT